MNRFRSISLVLKGTPTIEGAGVRLTRMFGGPDTAYLFDPFLLLDDFGSPNPDDYIAGFPWHPHRGIETVTYMLDGEVEHEDSTGSKGVLGPGGVQWMTAGSGIIHSEMPKLSQHGVKGFQLWVNLPSRSKFTHPLYRDVKAKGVPKVQLEGGGWVKVIAGSVGDGVGPVRDLAVPTEYLDVSLPRNSQFVHRVPPERTLLTYVYGGRGGFGGNADELTENRVALFDDRGDFFTVKASEEGVRFILASGKPLKEPVAWYGPIVMNTPQEVNRALEDYRRGTFIKARPDYEDAE